MSKPTKTKPKRDGVSSVRYTFTTSKQGASEIDAHRAAQKPRLPRATHIRCLVETALDAAKEVK